MAVMQLDITTVRGMSHIMPSLQRHSVAVHMLTIQDHQM